MWGSGGIYSLPATILIPLRTFPGTSPNPVLRRLRGCGISVNCAIVSYMFKRLQVDQKGGFTYGGTPVNFKVCISRAVRLWNINRLLWPGRDRIHAACVFLSSNASFFLTESFFGNAGIFSHADPCHECLISDAGELPLAGILREILPSRANQSYVPVPLLSFIPGIPLYMETPRVKVLGQVVLLALAEDRGRLFGGFDGTLFIFNAVSNPRIDIPALNITTLCKVDSQGVSFNDNFSWFLGVESVVLGSFSTGGFQVKNMSLGSRARNGNENRGLMANFVMLEIGSSWNEVRSAQIWQIKGGWRRERACLSGHILLAGGLVGDCRVVGCATITDL